MVSRLPRPIPTALGFLEFHIEQGPVLDALDLPLGVVDAIVGQTRCEVTFDGEANHAGTTPMAARHDALAGAAEWMVQVERLARETPHLVATVGRVVAEPGASNVIPGRCRAMLDLRHGDDAQRHAGFETVTRSANAIGRGPPTARDRRDAGSISTLCRWIRR